MCKERLAIRKKRVPSTEWRSIIMHVSFRNLETREPRLSSFCPRGCLWTSFMGWSIQKCQDGPRKRFRMACEPWDTAQRSPGCQKDRTSNRSALAPCLSSTHHQIGGDGESGTCSLTGNLLGPDAGPVLRLCSPSETTPYCEDKSRLAARLHTAKLPRGWGLKPKTTRMPKKQSTV